MYVINGGNPIFNKKYEIGKFNTLNKPTISCYFFILPVASKAVIIVPDKHAHKDSIIISLEKTVAYSGTVFNQTFNTTSISTINGIETHRSR